ncbi:hypothetical protein [Rhodococcus tibetensis]|uniref:Uncharacterized protein n=1 Tax=Rhodococcus tibetensis TaxID=2965064 RepID=A0ABT1QJS6_9NOCA|nr:hypothetical protein [Rhodococcus sp. FXJ9.536]MCQ4122549.1 hypothetical protein [Rhodococcus sp. FXJ9.536]
MRLRYSNVGAGGQLVALSAARRGRPALSRWDAAAGGKLVALLETIDIAGCL